MSRKGQMFIVTMLFLVGLIFTVQQLLFQYSAIDLSSSFRQNDIYLLENMKDAVNRTIKSTPDCPDFSQKMDELDSFMRSMGPKEGYALSIDYTLNCTRWNNPPSSDPPLNITMHIVGKGLDTYSRLAMYHK